MKSFADWTDEIRALMNPPAPMVDTCNLSALELGTAIHTGLEKLYECTPTGRIKWHSDDELAKRGIGKSHMQRMLNEFYGRLGENVNDEAWVKAYKDMVMTGTGTVQIIHDEITAEYDRVYVMAPQLKLAERWIRDNGVSPHRMCYLTLPEQLIGLARGSKILSVGNWMANKCGERIDQIQDIILARELEVVYVNDPY